MPGPLGPPTAVARGLFLLPADNPRLDGAYPVAQILTFNLTRQRIAILTLLSFIALC